MVQDGQEFPLGHSRQFALSRQGKARQEYILKEQLNLLIDWTADGGPYHYHFSAISAQWPTVNDMNTNTNGMATAASAADRYFRCYEAHCIKPDVDTLFNLLNALHSLNDKLHKHCETNFFSVNEFVALKALRNLFHHQAELLNEIRVVAAQDLPPLTTDLIFLCLVPRGLVETAIANVDAKRKAQDEPVIREVLKWYGNVVNINPCIFNFSVHVFEKSEALRLPLVSEGYESIKGSYAFEVANGHSHFIRGDIACTAGSVDEVLSRVFTDVV